MVKALNIICLLSFGAALNAQEINFENATWSEIKAKAKEQNKLIFLDAYTTWCGPCKAMAKNTFTNADVASFYNNTFINAKIDMEKGDGPEIAKQYEVSCYPNLLYIDGDGNLIHRSASYKETLEFLDLGKIALTPDKTFSSIQKQYLSGNASPGLASIYFKLLTESCLATREAVEKYFSTVKENEITSAENWGIIRDFVEDADATPFRYLVKYRKEYAVKYTADSVNQEIFNGYLNKCNKLVYQDIFDSTAIINLVKEIQSTGFDRTEELLLSIDLSYFHRLEKWDLYFNTCQNLVKKFKQNDGMFLNNVSWTYCEKCTDKSQLAEAESWAKKSVEIKEECANLDTYACLLFKNGKKQEAIKTEKKALELAKAAGEDTKYYEEKILEFDGKK